MDDCKEVALNLLYLKHRYPLITEEDNEAASCLLFLKLVNIVTPEKKRVKQVSFHIPEVVADSRRKLILLHQQQRLLLLKHASRCQEVVRCPVISCCAGVKRLWKHLGICKDRKCSFPHCLSSRYVLCHFRDCEDIHCLICGPVKRNENDTLMYSHNLK